MKNRLILAMLLAASVLTLAGQPVFADMSDQAEMGIEQLKSRLNLTPEQQSKIQPYADARKAKLQEVHAKMQHATSKRDKRAVMQEARKAQDDFVRNVDPLLTADQQAEWKKIRSEAREKMKKQWQERRQ